MKIEWPSHSRPRGPPPSTIHGWLAKWRGTFSGNEHLRKRGMEEMRKAAAHRKARRIYEQRKTGKQGLSLLSLFRRNKARTTRRPNRLSGRPRTRSTRPPGPRSKGSQHPSKRLATSRKPQSNSSQEARRKRLPPRSRHQPKPQQHGGSHRPHDRH
ncbi:hypothetical protein P691DRAFT_802427 [Macrolepiota fuliginosa MF-IS2]|uniref:Uncharacterized protein n=1 Tax=Macrolepiota fuliginosa MF-IS2 TaxID=1400762 RepID=A0A9P5XPW2_9AGAR|nr:hypothetical protein P691DRAFT_802427 [Macrolepiota fuliginosa MF-IS2]